MKKIFFKIFPSLILFAFIFIISCGEDSGINAAESDVSGTVTFVNTTFYTSGGYYAISIYTSVPTGAGANPIRSDSLKVLSGTSSYFYSVKGLAAGSYYAAVTWTRSGTNLPVLGTFGCDTSRTCSSHTRFDYPNAAGTGSTNIISWTDTTRRLN